MTAKKTAKKSPRRHIQPGRDPRTGRFAAGHRFSSKWTEKKALDLAEGLLAWMKEDPSHFMIGDYLFEHDLYSDVIAYLSEKFPPFSEHIARAREIEAHRIQKYALANKLNPGMAQWILAVNHGMHNVQKQEITGRDGAPLAPPEIIIQPVAPVQSDEDEH